MKKAKDTKKVNDMDRKFSELILLISELSEGDSGFGATKLNKLLFFSDYLAYQLFGESISGEEYEAMPKGPMPKKFYERQEELILAGDLAVREKNHGGYSQHRAFALRTADTSVFSKDELELISRVVIEHRALNASEISTKSHEFPGWKAVNIGEVIPYQTALISTRDLTLEEYNFPGNAKIEGDIELIQAD